MTPLQWILPPAFGFAIGYVTNALAIRMLFRPYREVRFLGLRFHGMVPRRKDDIARTVSRVVVSELLKEERVASRVAGDEVREGLERVLLELAGRYRDREYGPLSSLLDAGRAAALRAALAEVLLEVGHTFQGWIATDEGTQLVRAALDSLLDRSAHDFLRGEEALASKIAVGKVMELLASPHLESRVHRTLGQVLVRLAGDERPLGRYIPPEVVGALTAAVRDAVPALLRRFEQALLGPQNVRRIKGAVRAGIEAYLLETEGGLVKNLVRQAALMGRDRICQEADEIVDANLHRLRDLIYEEENRAGIEAAVIDALETFFLRRTPAQVLAAVPADALEGLYARAAAWICAYIRRPEVGEALAQLVERELEILFRVPFREVVRATGAGNDVHWRWGGALAGWLAEGGLDSVARREAPLLAKAILDFPIGKPSRFLPDDMFREVASIALQEIMPVLSGKIPDILQVIDVQGLIEREILAFSPEEIERVILSVARRELRSITWWGGVLGGFVGGLQSVLAWLG
jgi:uncharacterized membrane protein YheB (UPF0754 family)